MIDIKCGECEKAKIERMNLYKKKNFIDGAGDHHARLFAVKLF